MLPEIRISTACAIATATSVLRSMSRLQLAATEILRQHLNKAHMEQGAVVVMDATTGGILAMVSAPEPSFTAPAQAPHHSTDELLDRARYGKYPPGSTFKLVTAMAALRLDPENANRPTRAAGCPMAASAR